MADRFYVVDGYVELGYVEREIDASAGIVAGTLRFPFWKFLLACFMGKALLYIVMVETGVWGWEVILRYIG